MRASRRHFCAGLVVLGAGACTTSSSPGTTDDLAEAGGADLATDPSSCGVGTSAGPASAIVEGTPKYVSSVDAYVCRDAGGLYALSALCTHAGCTVAPSSSRFVCPCHGASFDLDGQHPSSPAHSALPHYALCVDSAGDAQVDTSQVVAASTRV